MRIALTLLLIGALGGGVYGLQSIFAGERGAAYAAVSERRRALEHYARVAAGRWAESRLRRVEGLIDRATNDPLAPAAGLYLERDGVVLLPRARTHRPGQERPGWAVYQAVMTGKPVPAPPETPLAERLRLRAAFLAALDSGEVAGAFRALLGHRARFKLEAVLDVPLFMATLAAFVDRGKPDGQLLRSLLHEGLEDRRGLRLSGLQRQLLRRRSAFTAPDFEALAEALVQLSRKARVPVDAFERALADEAPPWRPGELRGPSLTAGGAWYVQPEVGGARGVALEPGEIWLRVAEEMKSRGLLDRDDRLTPIEPEGVLERIRLKVESAHFESLYAQARRAWLYKSILAWLTGLLALLVLGLGRLLLRRQQRFVELKSDFVATVSHELRTPLASIRLMGETLERRLGDEPKARDYPSRIVAAADGLAFLVENILSFNRLDKGRWTPRTRRLHLGEVIEAVREDLARHAPGPVEWSVELPPDELEADPELLQLLFTNLARNACQYAERSPVRLRVQAEVDGAWLRLRFGDNGVGIPPESQAGIFTPFVRAQAQKKTPGSGLGLAICRRIAEAHHGRLGLAESSSEGTIFLLELPLPS
ncbi:MAG: HAMP domain-containing histidine kinase [Proteobacteria bacterium]|nr:HAMP domain-containing histidine kinase [Pseudomonadota bacterium]